MTIPTIIDRIFKKFGYVRSTKTRTLHCGWCGQEYTWTGNVYDEYPAFCTNTHKKRSQEARKKRKEKAQTPPKVLTPKIDNRHRDMSRVGRCPTPFKITFRTYEEAESVIKRVDPTMHTYRCECGALHIGHRKKTQKNLSR